MPKKIKADAKSLVFDKRFYSDAVPDQNTLFAVIIRSPARTGIIKSISHPKLPEGYFLFTAKDFKGSNRIKICGTEIQIFNEGSINYLGEPLALLAGPDESKLKKLISDIEIIFDASTSEDALKHMNEDKAEETDSSKDSSEEQIKEITKALALEEVQEEKKQTVSENTIHDFESDDKENFHAQKIMEKKFEYGEYFPKSKKTRRNLQDLLDKCDYIVQGCWDYSLKTNLFSEPTGAFCELNGDRLIIQTPALWTEELKKEINSCLGVSEENITIKRTVVTTQSMNSLWQDLVSALMTALVTVTTKKSCMLQYTRSEQENYVDNPRQITIAHKTGMDSDGKIKFMQVNIDVDTGAVNPFVKEMLERLTIAACGPYSAENICITANAYSSSNPPANVEFKQIDAAAFFAVENQINLLCSNSGFSPVEIKKLNIISTTRNNTLPFNFNLEKTEQTIQAVEKQSNFNRKYASYNLVSSSNKKNNINSKQFSPLFPAAKGIGFSCGFEGAGYLGSEIFSKNIFMELSLENEKSIIIHSAPVSCSVEEVWKNIVSEITGFSLSQIKIAYNDADDTDLPDSNFYNITILTTLLKKCAETLKPKLADKALKYPFYVKKTMTPAQKKNWNSETFTGSPFYRTSFGACTVEVELDPCTFKETIKNIFLVVNGGEILNAKEAESTLKLNIQLVLNSLVKDESLKCENITVMFMQSDAVPTQIGQLVFKTVPAAYTQAMSQALSSIVNHIPLDNNSVYRTMNERNLFQDVIKKEEPQSDKNESAAEKNSEPENDHSVKNKDEGGKK